MASSAARCVPHVHLHVPTARLPCCHACHYLLLHLQLCAAITYSVLLPWHKPFLPSACLRASRLCRNTSCSHCHGEAKGRCCARGAEGGADCSVSFFSSSSGSATRMLSCRGRGVLLPAAATSGFGGMHAVGSVAMGCGVAGAGQVLRQHQDQV